MSTHQDLLSRYEIVQSKMDKAIEHFPWENRDAYLSWLRQTYEYAKNSTRILALTAGFLTNTQYSNRFLQHTAEEKGHEKLLENDTKHLSSSLAQLKAFPEAKAFHQSLYYSMLYDDPMAVFGWVIMLEGVACRKGGYIYDRVVKAHGPKGASFLKVHATEDIKHIESALATLATITESERLVVIEAMEMYADLYCLVLNRVTAESSKQTSQAA